MDQFVRSQNVERYRRLLRPVEIQEFHLMAGCDSSFGWNDSY